MGIWATCTRCGRDFAFRQLANAAPAEADCCPHCGRRLGIVNLGLLAPKIDGALARLEQYLRMLAGHTSSFRIRTESVIDPLAEALSVVGDGAKRFVHDASRPGTVDVVPAGPSGGDARRVQVAERVD